MPQYVLPITPVIGRIKERSHDIIKTGDFYPGYTVRHTIRRKNNGNRNYRRGRI
jgi:hypothetical protein